MNTPRNFLTHCLVLGVCVSLSCVHSARAAREKMSEDIQQIMTPDEFKAAGLNKLTPDELTKLNAWLQGYRQVTEQAAEKKATARASRTKLDVLVSRVDGTFNGLTGRTIIRLGFRPKNTDHPAAVVIHGVFGYKMQLEGTQAFYVDPVRNP